MTDSSRGGPRPQQPTPQDVVVYGTQWCASSQMVRRYLDRLHVPYRYRDLEFDAEATRQVRWWTGCDASHPTVHVGGEVLVEPTLQELQQALDRYLGP
jgi:mycoredoxin